MYDYLYYLAKEKYRYYERLYGDSSCAYREHECIDRIRLIHKYEMLLEVISMLPTQQQIKLTEIEKEYFEDAPYVSK
ncbi:hypothetical protein L8C07_05725 [Paenibacillus sp. CMAA1739]|uniref:hypothetical protein n=1 Tax=Paenibacillus ottowii TaxID=2315729 RepID=UPI002DB67CC8|nr:hypothetical protein [Paenibacillus sp. CMAA1739]MEC4565437.1 hypothetical protein [Paenibacillus sp. CMAA1739]